MSNVLNMVSEQTFVTQTNAIKNAIDAIAGGGSDEFLLKPTGTVTVENGSFRVPYVGTEPLINTASIIIPNAPTGIVTQGISYSLQFSGGNAIFTLPDYSTEGILNTAVDCVVQIGTTWHKVSIQNLPVNYQVSIKSPYLYLTFSKMVLEEEYTVYTASLENNTYPVNVTPLPGCDAAFQDCILRDTNNNFYIGTANISSDNLLAIAPEDFEQQIDFSSITEGYTAGAYYFQFHWQSAEAEQ